MPDYGTFVADAKGILHDLSKHAFNSYNLTSSSHPLNASQPSLREDFTALFTDFKHNMQTKLGIDPEKGLSLEEIGDQMKEKALEAGTRMVLESAAGYGLKVAAELEGPLGLLLSEALSIVTSELSFALTAGDEYLPGQWVFIDCGLKTRLINQIPKVVELSSQFDIFSASNITVVPDELDYKSEAKHAIGFVLGKQKNGYEWSVFSFYTGKEEKIHTDKLRPCPQSFATKLDRDPDFSKVREVLFLKEHDPTLKSYMPTEPGEQVFYKGQPHFIKSQAGGEYELIGPKGETVHCQTGDLVPGKTETSQRWNHEELHLGHYENEGFYSGEWVWVPAEDLIAKLMRSNRRKLAQEVPDALRNMQPENMVLAMVESIEGDTLHVVRAYDGAKVDQPWNSVFPAKDSVQGLLNRDKACGPWKLRVLEGASSTQVTPGQTHPMLTLGLGEATSEELKQIEKPEVVERKLPTFATTNQDLVTQNKIKDIRKQDRQEEDLVQFEDPAKVIEYPEERQTSSDFSTSTGTLLLVVGAAVLYMTYA